MKLFLPQATLEQWVLDDKADVREGMLQVQGDAQPYPVTEAVHFVQCVSGEDTAGLLNKVKPESALGPLGAERAGESVLLGDTAYEITPGYLAEVPAPAVKDEKPTEQALLEALLLKKL